MTPIVVATYLGNSKIVEDLLARFREQGVAQTGPLIKEASEEDANIPKLKQLRLDALVDKCVVHVRAGGGGGKCYLLLVAHASAVFVVFMLPRSS